MLPVKVLYLCTIAKDSVETQTTRKIEEVLDESNIDGEVLCYNCGGKMPRILIHDGSYGFKCSIIISEDYVSFSFLISGHKRIRIVVNNDSSKVFCFDNYDSYYIREVIDFLKGTKWEIEDDFAKLSECVKEVFDRQTQVDFKSGVKISRNVVPFFYHSYSGPLSVMIIMRHFRWPKDMKFYFN